MSSVDLADLKTSPNQNQDCIVLWKAILLTCEDSFRDATKNKAKVRDGVAGFAFLIGFYILLILIEIIRYMMLRNRKHHHIGRMTAEVTRMRDSIPRFRKGKGKRK
jgi:hypothetical protein